MAFSSASFLLRLAGEMAGTAGNFDLLVTWGTDDETWRRDDSADSVASSSFASLILSSFASFISSGIAGFEDVLLLVVILFVSATSLDSFFVQ
jgi:hypothetical protein